jgi:hypothetical protein
MSRLLHLVHVSGFMAPVLELRYEDEDEEEEPS